ncbi:MAG: CFI-box-CTERM domain-containing protein [Phycisphaerae bacterium]
MLGIYGGGGFDGQGYGTIGQNMPIQPTPSGPSAPIGGTGATPGGSNSLSMNLGGVNLSYDLGPNVSTIAAQSAQFLNNSFQNDANFLGGAIVGANSLVTNLTAPLIDAAQYQMTVNNTQLPSLYNTLMSQNFALGQGAINAETQVANASIAASRSAAQSAGGGCYVTTAVCDTLGLGDDCYTLTTLRNFRDHFLARTNVGRAFIEEYYATAPRLCEKMRTRKDAREYFMDLYSRFILPALLAIEHGKPEAAFKTYRQMIYTVRAENP